MQLTLNNVYDDFYLSGYIINPLPKSPKKPVRVS